MFSFESIGEKLFLISIANNDGHIVGNRLEILQSISNIVGKNECNFNNRKGGH